ncbi:MAG: hypothetical protein R3E31_19965 [Chloroflexota bacterium]
MNQPEEDAAWAHFTAGSCLSPLPLLDLSQTKLRLAVVLADAGRDDWILCCR